MENKNEFSPENVLCDIIFECIKTLWMNNILQIDEYENILKIIRDVRQRKRIKNDSK